MEPIKLTLLQLAQDADQKSQGGNGNGKLLDTDREISVFENSARANGFTTTAVDEFKTSLKAGVTSPISAQVFASNDEQIGDSFESKTVTNPQAKMAEELREKFDNVIQTMHGTEAGQEVIRKNGGDNYKAYLDIVHDEVKHKGWRKDGTKKAFKELKKFVKHQAQEANDDVALGREGATAEVGYGKNKVNKHHEELIEYDKIAAKRLEELKAGVTYAEMEEKLGKKLAEKLKPYAEQHKLSDGLYDLSGLRTDRMFGADLYKGSDNVVKTHEDPKESERIAMQEGFGLIAGNDKNMFSTGETKDIIEFVGLQNAKRSHNIADAAKDELPGVVAGVIAGMSFWVEQNQNIVINGLTKETANQVASQTGGTATASAGGKFTVKFHQKQAANLFGLAPALATVGLTILLKTIIGEEKGERNCFNVKEASYYKTLSELEEFATKKYPEKAEALMTLANYYVEQYGGDQEKGLNKLYDYLNKVHSGINSPMDPDECWMAFKATLPPPPQEETDIPDERKEEKPPVCDEDEPCYTVDEYIHERKYGDTWGGIVSAYYPCLVDELGESRAIRALKIALSKDENGNIDKNVFKALLSGGNIPKTIKLPKEIDGCQREDAKVVARKVSGNGKSKIDNVGLASATDCDTKETVYAKDKKSAVTKLGSKTGKTYIK